MAKKGKVGASSGLTESDASGLLEIREDNALAIVNAMDQALARALEEVGLVAEGYAKKACPVDTGRLRNGITHQVRPSEKSVYSVPRTRGDDPEDGTSTGKAGLCSPHTRG